MPTPYSKACRENIGAFINLTHNAINFPGSVSGSDYVYLYYQGASVPSLNRWANRIAASNRFLNGDPSYYDGNPRAYVSDLAQTTGIVMEVAGTAAAAWSAVRPSVVSNQSGIFGSSVSDVATARAYSSTSNQGVLNSLRTANVEVYRTNGTVNTPVRGGEIRLSGQDFRVAPFGNMPQGQNPNPYSTKPHYHLRVTDSSGQTIPGQGVGRHRPLEVYPSDTSFWDRFGFFK